MEKNLRVFKVNALDVIKKYLHRPRNEFKRSLATIVRELTVRGSLQLLTFRKTPTGGHQQSRGWKIIQAGVQTGCVHIIIVLERLIHLDQRNVVVLAGRFVVRMWYEPLENSYQLNSELTTKKPNSPSASIPACSPTRA